MKNHDTELLRGLLTVVLSLLGCGVVWRWTFYKRIRTGGLLIIACAGPLFGGCILHLMSKLHRLDEKRRGRKDLSM